MEVAAVSTLPLTRMGGAKKDINKIKLLIESEIPNKIKATENNARMDPLKKVTKLTILNTALEYANHVWSTGGDPAVIFKELYAAVYAKIKDIPEGEFKTILHTRLSPEELAAEAAVEELTSLFAGSGVATGSGGFGTSARIGSLSAGRPGGGGGGGGFVMRPSTFAGASNASSSASSAAAAPPPPPEDEDEDDEMAGGRRRGRGRSSRKSRKSKKSKKVKKSKKSKKSRRTHRK